MAIGSVQRNQPGLQLPENIKSPMEVIDILASLRIDGEPVVKDDKAFLNPDQKANAVINYFKNFGVAPNELPHLASVIKQELRQGKINWEA